MKINLKSLLPHFTAIVIFLALVLIYFQPVTEGYKLKQYDNTTFMGTSKEIRDFREKYGEEPLWTNTVFGGMPATLISVKYNNNWMNQIERAFELWLPHPLNLIFVCMLGFYILFLCLKVDPWLAIVGAIAFGFSTYNFLIIEAGHNTKALAMAWMAPTLGAIIYTYRHKALWGAALTMLFMALELRSNHLQVTYYLFMIIFLYGIFEFVQFIMRGEIKKFLIRSAFVVGALGVGVLPNYSMLKSIIDVAGETTRSESKLTITPDGKSNKGDKTSGLNRSYIVDYSYGRLESFNLFIPNAVGVNEAIGNYEDIVSEIENQQVAQQVAQSSAYWSDESNGGPNYIGAVIITLFLLSFLFITDLTKWGFLAVGFLALLLAWGANAAGLTDFFIDNVPGYNKFRAVTIILVVLQVIIPLLGVWGIHYLVTRVDYFKINIKRFYIGAGAILGFTILFFLFGSSSFAFLSTKEKEMFANTALQAGTNVQQMQFVNEIKKELINARAAIFTNDCLRTIGFVIGTLFCIFLFIRQFINKYILYGALGLLVLIDLWTVDIRFLNNDESTNGQGTYMSWVLPEEQAMPHYASDADYVIFETELRKQPQLLQSISQLENSFQKQKDAQGSDNPALTLQESDNIRFRELNFATNYRVLSLENPFNDGRTSYFHKSIGGYTGAKQKRIQEIVEFHYSKEMTALNPAFKSNNFDSINIAFSKLSVLNMMNAKYIIINSKGKGIIGVGPDTIIRPTDQPSVIINNYAFGNAWFVNNLKEVKNDDEEILALGNVELRNTAIMQKEMISKIKAKTGSGKGTIELKSYKPNKLVYEIDSDGDNLALFSEIFTEKGWTAKLDNKEIPIARANYLIRAVSVPDGKHVLEFKFDLPSYRTGEKVSLAGSVLVLAFFFFALYKVFQSGFKEPESVVTGKSKNDVID